MQAFVKRFWKDEILPTLSEYIGIKAVSPDFDRQWMENGQIVEAVSLTSEWCRRQLPRTANVMIMRIPNRTPLLFIEVLATDGSDKTVLMYGHLDKQPPMEGWSEGLDPWTPVLRDGKLYGRGGADDGYAVFAAVCALRALEDQKIPHARIVMMIECSEESGSPDLPAYVEHLKEEIHTPSLVIALDSGAGDYERLWLTTSLRGVIGGKLRVQVLTKGVHSGSASGIVPDPFRILRLLLDRVEDAQTGLVNAQLHGHADPRSLEQTAQTAALLGERVKDEFPWHGDTRSATDNLSELLHRRNHLPALTITGADGLPPSGTAGNVLLPWIELKVSLRLMPLTDAAMAIRVLKRILEDDPPCNATVTFTPDAPAAGWQAPELAPWLKTSLACASNTFFNNPFATMGEGGTIPFMRMLGERFPEAQIVVTGVLGPDSNAHGPDECLHLDFAQRLTCCLANVLRDHARQA